MLQTSDVTVRPTVVIAHCAESWPITFSSMAAESAISVKKIIIVYYYNKLFLLAVR